MDQILYMQPLPFHTDLESSARCASITYILDSLGVAFQRRVSALGAVDSVNLWHL